MSHTLYKLLSLTHTVLYTESVTRSDFLPGVAFTVIQTVFWGNYRISTSHVSYQREVSLLCQHEIE